MKLNILFYAGMASAHTLFTTLFVNGENQGDGTCVRQPLDPYTAVNPIYPLDGDSMACGRSSLVPGASSSALLSFQSATTC